MLNCVWLLQAEKNFTLRVKVHLRCFSFVVALIKCSLNLPNFFHDVALFIDKRAFFFHIRLYIQ